MADEHEERHMGVAAMMPDRDEIHILWLSTRKGRDGETESRSSASSPNAEDLIPAGNPGLPKVHLHTGMPACRESGGSPDAFRRAVRGELSPFVLVVEGPVPGGTADGAEHRSRSGEDPRTGTRTAFAEWIDLLAPRAWAVVATGAPAGGGELAEHLGRDFRSAGGLPVVNVPGGPTRSGDLGETLLGLLHRAVRRRPPDSSDDERPAPVLSCGETVSEGPPDGTSTVSVDFERMRAVADAILYEGYLLYPYRKSSPKNRVRWQFGVLAPRSWVTSDGPVAPTVAGSVESWRQRTECLLQASHGAVVHVRVRFLQLQTKSVQRRTSDGGYEPVESLEVGGAAHLTFDEAVPRESDIVVPLAEMLDAERVFEIGAPGGEEVEQLGGGSARIVRRRRPISAATTLHAQRLDGRVAAYRLRVTTENSGPAIDPDVSRNEALRHSLIAAHTFLGGDGLAFESLIEPAEWAAPHARACRNIHTFPVLAGDGDARDRVLSSPILLYDHPQVAPESPGDLHDAAEIDEILSLRTLTLTDEEKREARATDPRAAEILDRVEGMPPEVMARLHGAVRSLSPGPAAGETTEGGV